MNNNNFLQCPPNNRGVVFRLLLFAVVISLILIANPSFYSHDELEKLDYIQLNGFAAYLKKYLMLKPGGGVALTVGPIGYLVQGLVALFMSNYPFVAHLIYIVLHGLTAYTLFVAVADFSKNRGLAWGSALLFLAVPLTVFSVGAGAVADSLYILFGLMAFIASGKYILGESSWGSLLTIVIASFLALLSKETAMVLPLTLLAYPVFLKGNVPAKRLWTALAAWSLPVLLFLLNRLPALTGDAQAKAVLSLAPSPANIPQGLFVYFIYPFMPFLTESHNWRLESSITIVLAIASHLLLLVLVWRAFTWRAVIGYLGGYLLFVVPVVAIQTTGSTYLYGSGIAFSLALGALLTMKWDIGSKSIAWIPILLLGLSVLHTLTNQVYFYNTGMCMKKITDNVDSVFKTDNSPDTMAFLVEPAAPGYILRRYLHNKKNIGTHAPISFDVVDWEQRNKVRTDYSFDCNCTVARHPDFKPDIKSWGPQTAALGSVPNPQPDGSAGFWMEIPTAEGLGDVEMLIDGKPATLTSLQPKVITAAFPADFFREGSAHKLSLRQVFSGKEYQVGTLQMGSAN